jgi:hypothetical protein
MNAIKTMEVQQNQILKNSRKISFLIPPASKVFSIITAQVV